ncbi:acetyl-CoA C-acyltransferase [Pseudoroseomonas cervicalis]|uniref:acetyl-CoA C-acyltransferase n=1 Tax=Teichococcus cervicalis TaxID=204525 RepID=UPI00278B3FE2|nr:acetyl-CoA C-acyltransferase [Pseudoroseomonas cervicalis]MDQ1077810.1 acetyl-CoA C-acetyltransferase [Pseudoroseomonas cervicalis]
MTETERDPVVIAAAARTPLGRFQGGLAGVPAPRLGAAALSAVLRRAGLAPEAVEEVLMGCVLPAGLGQAPARQAARAAGLPDATGAATINKVCGSGMKAAMLGHDALLAGSARLVLAGGMESMSGAPYLLDRARGGYRIGHGRVLDHLLLDGLEDAYEPGRSMGSFGEAAAERYGFTRADQDAYAMETLRRAQAALASGAFAAETVPIATPAGEVAADEIPQRLSAERIPTLKPAFRPDGSITAASSSANADGAAALLLARRSTAEAMGLPVLATIRGHATQAQAPEWFTTAPAPAIRKLVERIGWRLPEVDLFEINEAFAVVTMAAMRELDLPAEAVNIHGGACALGHPIGATGARLIVTLLHALQRHGLRRGIAALCIGGGEATAIAIERAE